MNLKTRLPSTRQLLLVAYLDSHKELLEQSASSALGREIRIEDGVKLHWSMTPSITLEGLWIGNPDWASGKYLLRSERAFLQFGVAALLQHRLLISQVMLEKAEINLETAMDGQHNWHFDSSTSSNFKLIINAFEVKTSQLHVRSSNDQHYHIGIQHLELLGVGSEVLRLETEFSYHDVPFSVSATSENSATNDPHRMPRSTGRPFKGRLTTNNASMNFSGHLQAPLALADLEVYLSSDLLALSRLWPSSPVRGSLRQITARLKTAGGTPQLLLNNLSGNLAIGSARLTLPASKGETVRKVTLSSINISTKPDQPVRLQSAVEYEKHAFELELTAGTLAELISQDKPWQTIKIKTQSQIDNKPLFIAGKFGPLSAVFTGRNLRIDLVAHHNHLKARAEGKLARFNKLEGSHLAIAVTGPSLALLKHWLDEGLPESAAFSFGSQLEGREHRLELKDIKTKIGKSDLIGEISFPLSQQDKVIQVNLKSNLLDLMPFLSTDKEPERDKDKLSILERELPPQTLQELNGILQFEIEHLQAVENIMIDDIKFNAKLHHGHIKLTMTANGDRLKADVDLKPEDTQWKLVLNHQGKLDLNRLLKQEQVSDGRSEVPLVLDIKLNGSGGSLSSILGSADGSLMMELGAGHLSENISRQLLLGSVIYTLLNTIQQDNSLRANSILECAVFQLDISNGIATSTRGLALRTDSINALGGGSVKLRSGEIELQFKTAQRKGLGFSVLGIADNIFSVTGTLLHPRIKVNLGGLLLHVGAAWATDGISLLYETLFRRLTAFSNPCQTVLKAVKW